MTIARILSASILISAASLSMSVGASQTSRPVTVVDANGAIVGVTQQDPSVATIRVARRTAGLVIFFDVTETDYLLGLSGFAHGAADCSDQRYLDGTSF